MSGAVICPICQHADVNAINAALVKGENATAVAAHFGLPSIIAVVKHRREHLPLRLVSKPPPVRQTLQLIATEATAPTPGRESPPEPPRPPPPNRAPQFQSYEASRYRYLWEMQPLTIGRMLSPAERCNPDWNPCHPAANSLPPEVRMCRTLDPREHTNTLDDLERRKARDW